KRLMKLVGVGRHRGKIGSYVEPYRDVWGEGLPHEMRYLSNDPVDIHRPEIRVGLARKRQQLMNDSGSAFDRFFDDAERLGEPVSFGVTGHDGRIDRNHVQDVVEVVRKAAGKLADRLQLLNFAQLLFELSPLRRVAIVELRDLSGTLSIHI